MKIPFYKYESDREEHSNVSDVLDGEDVDQIKKLENEIVDYLGVSYVLATSHGTSALHLAMLALDLKRGDKVVCSVNAFPNIPEVVRHFDAEPAFIDIDANSYNIDLDKLESYLEENKSKKLKAVIVTHIAGCAVDLDRLYNIAKIYDVKIVEDAGDALGATYKDQKIGSMGGDITCFDFSPHLKKKICNGGVLVTNNEEIYKRAKLLHNHALVQDENSLEYIYDVTSIGNDYSLSQLNAAFLRAYVKGSDKNIIRQKEIASMYSKALDDVDHIIVPSETNEEHPYFLYIVKIDKNRDSFAKELYSAGIQTGLHYIPLHLIAYYKTKYSLKINDFPVALTKFQQILSLPLYADMSDDDVKFVIKTLKKIAKTRV
jgi:dTDP-4-amino-4,6-dideoxygalactose transaminase